MYIVSAEYYDSVDVTTEYVGTVPDVPRATLYEFVQANLSNYKKLAADGLGLDLDNEDDFVTQVDTGKDDNGNDYVNVLLYCEDLSATFFFNRVNPTELFQSIHKELN